MPKQSFTAQWVDSVSGSDARVDYFDQKLPGLGLRVSPSGAKSWFFMYRPKGSPKKARLTLGRYPAYSLADARDMVRERALAVARGHDPAEERRERDAAPTFAEFADAYIDKYAKVHKRSWHEDQRVIRVELSLGMGGSFLDQCDGALAQLNGMRFAHSDPLYLPQQQGITSEPKRESRIRSGATCSRRRLHLGGSQIG